MAQAEQKEKQHKAWQEAMRAWEQCQITGLHVSEEEMEAWFDQLEAGIDAEPPVCHR